MKKHLLIQSLVLAFPVLGLTSVTAATTPIKPLNEVYVPVHRVLESGEQRYFLQMTTGVSNPQATLFDRIDQRTVYFNGTQKGNDLSLYSVDQLVGGKDTGTHKITAHLNVSQGTVDSEMISNTEQRKLMFQPVVQIKNRPNFNFKFYGNTTIQQVNVTERSSQRMIQQLKGFEANPARMDYMDLNFDGYYDLVFTDAHDAKRYIYWMYNPKTAQFQRAPQLEKLAGEPKLDGLKREVSFGQQRFKVEQGLLRPL